MPSEGSRDLAFIRECVARNPGGYTGEFRFILARLALAEAVVEAARVHSEEEGHALCESPAHDIDHRSHCSHCQDETQLWPCSGELLQQAIAAHDSGEVE